MACNTEIPIPRLEYHPVHGSREPCKGYGQGWRQGRGQNRQNERGSQAPISPQFLAFSCFPYKMVVCEVGQSFPFATSPPKHHKAWPYYTSTQAQISSVEISQIFKLGCSIRRPSGLSPFATAHETRAHVLGHLWSTACLLQVGYKNLKPPCTGVVRAHRKCLHPLPNVYC